MATANDGFVSDSASPLSLRLLLIVAALAKLVDSAAAVPALFMNHAQIPGPGIAGLAILAGVALKPLLAISAIGCSLIKRMRPAVCALAVAGVYLPPAPDLSIPVDSADMIFFAMVSVPPLFAITAIMLALFTRRLNVAIVLSSLPAITLLALMAGSVVVSIHGS